MNTVWCRSLHTTVIGGLELESYDYTLSLYNIHFWYVLCFMLLKTPEALFFLS